MAITSFTAEKTDSGDQKFAIFQTATDSFIYPVGFTAWGSSGSINVTSTSAPYPVQLFGNGLSSSNPVFVTTDSGAPPTVAVSGYVAPSTTVTVTGYVAPSTTVTVTGYVAPSTTVTVTGYVAPSTTVTLTNPTDTTVTVAALSTTSIVRTQPATSSATPTFVTNNSATQLYVRSDSNNPVFVRDENSTTVTVTGYVAPSTTVTLTNPTDTTVTISNSSTGQIGVALNTQSAGGALSTTFALSSLAQTIGGLTAVGKLWGLSLSNPDTAANVWVKVFDDDSAGVTLGTTVPKINQMIPFGGGREMQFPMGLALSSGLSIATAASAASTAHDAPSTTTFVTVYYTPST